MPKLQKKHDAMQDLLDQVARSTRRKKNDFLAESRQDAYLKLLDRFREDPEKLSGLLSSEEHRNLLNGKKVVFSETSIKNVRNYIERTAQNLQNDQQRKIKVEKRNNLFRSGFDGDASEETCMDPEALTRYHEYAETIEQAGPTSQISINTEDKQEAVARTQLTLGRVRECVFLVRKKGAHAIGYKLGRECMDEKDFNRINEQWTNDMENSEYDSLHKFALMQQFSNGLAEGYASREEAVPGRVRQALSESRKILAGKKQYRLAASLLVLLVVIVGTYIYAGYPHNETAGNAAQQLILASEKKDHGAPFTMPTYKSLILASERKDRGVPSVMPTDKSQILASERKDRNLPSDTPTDERRA